VVLVLVDARPCPCPTQCGDVHGSLTRRRIENRAVGLCCYSRRLIGRVVWLLLLPCLLAVKLNFDEYMVELW
jgi:hypothetical protein